MNAFGPAASACAFAVLIVAPLPLLAGQGFKTLYTFTGGADGSNPGTAPLMAGPNGSLIGITQYGGSAPQPGGYGTIYQLTPPPAGQAAWTLVTLHAFTGRADGGNPSFSLVAGPHSSFYGTTSAGGIFNKACAGVGCGTIFQITPPAAGQTAWRFGTIYKFTGGVGSQAPYYLTLSASGDLFGDSYNPGPVGEYGSIFELTKPAAGETKWTASVLYTSSTSSTSPASPPLLDNAGDIILAIPGGGDTGPAACRQIYYGCGTIAELQPPAVGQTAWTLTTLWTFTGKGGASPQGPLARDTNGNIYGVTTTGGDIGDDCGFKLGCGTAFELSPPGPGVTGWSLKTLYAFRDGATGAEPLGGLIGSNASLYLTTSGNEPTTDGTVNAILPPAAGKLAWRNKTLFSFSGDVNGGGPLNALLLQGGLLYGTTYGLGSGPAGYGTVFSVGP